MENQVKHPAYKGLRSTVAGIIVNVILALIKGIAGYLGNSYALIADAIESVSDVLTSLIVLLGLKIAARKPNQRYPYGFGKAEPLAAVSVGLILISMAILIATQSIQNIKIPHKVPAPFTLIVLALVIISKEVLFHFVIRVSSETKSTAVRADAWHHRSDALTSAAAFIGISIALIGGRGYESADDWAALFASGIIFYNGFNILRPAIAEVLDAAPPEDIILEIKNTARSVKGVMALDKCLVRKTGFDYYVDLHVVVNGEIPVIEGHEIAHRVKTEILSKNPRILDVIVHVEPYNRTFFPDQ